MALQMTQDDLESLFSKIADDRIAAAMKSSADEGAKAKAEEARKAEFRAASYEVIDAFTAKAAMNGTKAPDPLDLFGRYVVCGWKSANLGESKIASKDGALKAAQMLYPEDKALAGLLKKDLQVGVPSAGGFSVPQILSPDVIRVLYANTILEKTGATKVPMPNGNFRMTRMDTSSTVGWVGEIPANTSTQPVLGDVNLNAKKLFALVPMSNSLIRYNAVGLDSWVSQDLARKAAIALDLAALYGTGTLYQPLGLAGGSGTVGGGQTNVQTVGSSSTAFGLTTPIDMTSLLEQANVPMLNPCWVMSPAMKGWIKGKAFSTGPFAWANEMNISKTLNSMPFVSSASVYWYAVATQYGDVWLGDWSEFIWGVGYDLSLEISREASYVSGSTTYSAFQRDETLIRLVAEHDFSVKHGQSFVQGTYKQA